MQELTCSLHSASELGQMSLAALTHLVTLALSLLLPVALKHILIFSSHLPRVP